MIKTKISVNTQKLQINTKSDFLEELLRNCKRNIHLKCDSNQVIKSNYK